jgi:DNA processing protein
MTQARAQVGGRANTADAHEDPQAGGSCRACLRRSWLLSVLGTRLDYRTRDEPRLLALLELEDEQLIDAIAGGRAREIRPRWERFESLEPAPDCRRTDVASMCRHGYGWPRALAACGGAPRALFLTSEAERLHTLSARPTVAIVGSPGASDYGLEIARSIGRGLAASGVTVVSGFAAGVGSSGAGGRAGDRR